MNNKDIELLMPVGEVETFFAAIEGGANAVYLGLRKFNARGRAVNFTINQLLTLIKLAKKANVKVFVTLNTVIKNEELSELVEILHTLSKTDVNAIIIQDWGVAYIAKKFFPNLVIHASTQMANHNSEGVEMTRQAGFERVIMARELTMSELTTIAHKSKTELEIFVHGALCYSFSGICLFSSYLGGMGANRGMCAQPCRRLYKSGNKAENLFSLKDNQLIDYVQDFMKLGITSLKIEGRMKSAEYVYRVAQAYRIAIDNPENLDQARELLAYDMGRDKTSYFIGRDGRNAITTNPNTGVFIGEIERKSEHDFTFYSDFVPQKGNRLRIRSSNGDVRKAFKIKEFSLQEKFITIETDTKDLRKGDKIFLAGMQQKKFPNKLDEIDNQPNIQPINNSFKGKIFKDLYPQSKKIKPQLFVRIDTLKWLKKIRLDSIDGVILNFSKDDWDELKFDAFFLKKNSHKIYIELPKFIAENDLDFYKALCQKSMDNGYKNYMLSHLSQKLIIPKDGEISTNENVYIYNDAAIKFLKSQKVNSCTYPLENDYENLLRGKDRSGIVPLFFYPHLFYSRMPVKIHKNNTFEDDMGNNYSKIVRDSITIVIPEHPVSLFQNKKELLSKGFNRFLIDLSHEKESQNTFKKIMGKYSNSQQLQPSTSFNFKKGLK